MPELLWKPDPNVDAARRTDGWVQFHRECGKQYLYFDHIERASGKRSDYVAVAFTLVGKPRRVPEKVAEGRGKTVLDALADAFRLAGEAGFEVPAAEPWIAAMLQPTPQAAPTPAPSEFDDFDPEDILG